MATSRSAAGVTVIDGCIYVAGGYDGYTGTCTACCCFDQLLLTVVGIYRVDKLGVFQFAVNPISDIEIVSYKAFKILIAWFAEI